MCREYGLTFSAGPGLPILNHVAADCLRSLGAESATISIEADRGQIEDLCQAAALPLSLIVYSRPVLAYTRIPTDCLLADGAKAMPAGANWRDRRGIGLHPERTASVTVFRSLDPFNWAGIVNKKIRVANLVMDLSAESYPVTVWKDFNRPARREFLFNYERGLKRTARRRQRIRQP